MWPEDVREYFGDGDECHMAYHFPLMPRMYMAIAQEDRHPMVEILAQTPEIPANCQWAIFLRNHDELTLEMVTSKERDYMYRMYASDAQARINLGIRRRLAPLLENDRPHQADEQPAAVDAGHAGAVLRRRDRHGRQHLPGRPRRRAHADAVDQRPQRRLLRADPQRLYLPPIQDPMYGYEAVNVEAQAREPSSLLNWTKRLLAVRAADNAFGRGRFTMLQPGNRKVLAYVREHEDDVILCVANVSRVAQPVELELAYKVACRSRCWAATASRRSRSALPADLPAYGFFWFRLATDAAPPAGTPSACRSKIWPVLVLFDGWNSFFRSRVVPWRIALAEKTRAQLELALLPRFMLRQRWYRRQGRAAHPRHTGRTCGAAPCPGVSSGCWRWSIRRARRAARATSCRWPIAFEDDDEERTRRWLRWPSARFASRR
jgi:maltose alpha-D-glucosyltransferase/alpha-amylase